MAPRRRGFPALPTSLNVASMRAKSLTTRLFLVVALLGVVLMAVIAYRTATFASLQRSVPATTTIPVDAGVAAQRLAGALVYPTVSHQDRSAIDRAAFTGLHAYLAERYPRVHQSLRREAVAGLSLLYTWEGADPSLPPVILMAHQDVVPVARDNEQRWQHGPFAGVIADGYVWGRGALDDKLMVLGILEAVEALLTEGYRPQRTFYLAFGHDEEVGGTGGAAAIVRVLRARGVTDAALILDEGLPITTGLFPGVTGPLATIGIAEKGYVSLALRVEGEGGHSAMPPPATNIGILAGAVRRLEEAPFDLRLTEATEHQFRFLGPELSFANRVVLANLWLFEPLFLRRMAAMPPAAAMLRTTTAATMFNAGVKENVLPAAASAVVNLRILQDDTVDSVVQRVREVIDDARIQIDVLQPANDPSPVSDPRSAAFQFVERTIRETWNAPDLVVVPTLVIGGTDSKHYAGLSDNVLRFAPVQVESAADVQRWHGPNERVAIEAYADTVRFYQRLIRNLEGL